MGKRQAPWEYTAASRPLPEAAAVLAAVRKNEPRPLSHVELIRHFHLDTAQEKPFKKLMKALVKAGALERLKGKRYLIPLLDAEPLDSVVSDEEGDEEEVEGDPASLPAEPVAVKAEKTSDKPHSSQLPPLAEAKKFPSGPPDANRIRGQLVKQGQFFYALPIAENETGALPAKSSDKAIGKEIAKPDPKAIKGLRSRSDRILIPRKHIGKAKPGDMVMVQILEPAQRGKEAVGKVLSGFRREATFGEVAHKFLGEYGLSLGYPRKASHEVVGFAEPVYSPAHGREDLRHLHIITIDPSTARDHDDAISLEKMDNGHWRLGVHIADVAEYVTEDSTLDEEARRRAYTQYLPWTAIPMLPSRLSTDLCSLREGCERLAFSCFMEVSPNGQLGRYRFVESFIRVAKFYSYEEAQGVKDGGDPHLALLDEFARLRADVRKRDGNLEFQFPEPKVICDAEGIPVDVYPGERLASHGWIEECMLLCNQAAAKYLTSHKLPGLFRVHEQPDLDVVAELFATQGGPHPDPELIKAFAALRETKGYLNPAVQKFYARLLSREAGGLPPAVQRKILMSMKKALYAPQALGHFALGWLHYAHFTSPIRRYADLWIHRIMKSHLRGKKQYRDEKNEAVAIAEEISEREIAVMKIERKGMKTATAWVLQKHIGREFTATITGVEEFGLFVSITHPYGEGMVPVARLGDDFFSKDAGTYSLVGKRSKVRFTLGQTLPVRLTRCNPFSGQVDFEPVKAVGASGGMAGDLKGAGRPGPRGKAVGSGKSSHKKKMRR